MLATLKEMPPKISKKRVVVKEPNLSSIKCYQWSLSIELLLSNTGSVHGSHSGRTRPPACWQQRTGTLGWDQGGVRGRGRFQPGLLYTGGLWVLVVLQQWRTDKAMAVLEATIY